MNTSKLLMLLLVVSVIFIGCTADLDIQLTAKDGGEIANRKIVILESEDDTDVYKTAVTDEYGKSTVRVSFDEWHVYTEDRKFGTSVHVGFWGATAEFDVSSNHPINPDL